MADEGLNFDSLERISIPVTIEGKKYTLEEATLATGIKYRDMRLSSSIIKDGEVVGTKGSSFVMPVIMSECLFDCEHKPVPADIIRGWPDRVTTKIWDKLAEISGFIEEETIADLERRLAELKKAEAQRGNSSGSTTGSSD